MLTDVAGVRVGHWSNFAARTGCSVVLLPAGTTASGEVRGGAPGTREWALLAPERRVEHVDAVVLTGGSAFGLSACDGVVRWCEERGIGFPAPAGPVPIVVGMVLYDLSIGDAKVRPGPEEGYAACRGAVAGAFATGAVGAGTGATVAKWPGLGGPRPGGLGTASASRGDLVVAALVALNAAGDIRGPFEASRAPLDPSRGSPPSPLPPGGRSGAGDQGPEGAGLARGGLAGEPSPGLRGAANGQNRAGQLESTTIGVVATNAALGKVECLLVAQSAHDGLARALEPVHTRVDGDAFVAAATGVVEASVDEVRELATEVVERAVRLAPAGR